MLVCLGETEREKQTFLCVVCVLVCLRETEREGESSRERERERERERNRHSRVCNREILPSHGENSFSHAQPQWQLHDVSSTWQKNVVFLLCRMEHPHKNS